MDSRFKFVQSVNPQPIPTNAIKPKFSKLTLATTKFMTVESVNAKKESTVQATQTVTCTTTTTTTTTMTKVLNEQPVDIESDELSCAQKPKILLYESTTDETHLNIMTDDDTDSVGSSSIDSKEIEELKISQPITQNPVANINRIDTQMKNLSFLTPLSDDRDNSTVKSDDHLQHMSRQFDQLDLQNDDSEYDKTQEKSDNAKDKSVLSCSVQTLSSNDTEDHEYISSKQTKEKNESDVVIVLSDSDTEEAASESESRKRNISQEPPLKPIYPSSNDGAMYNLSSIDSSAMQKVNNFFDNAPFIEPSENSFNSSHVSKTTKEDIYVPETTDEESIDDNSVIEPSIDGDNKPYKGLAQEPIEQQIVDDDVDHDKPEFSDNNIIVDIPVIKSTSDQPRQLIRSQSGVRLTGSRSSPIIKSGGIDSDCIKRTASNLILKTPGSSIRVNSSNGQLSIAAKININIQIVEDSSEESSEDNKPSRKSAAIQSSEDCQRSSDGYVSVNSKHSDDAASKLKKVSSSKSPKKDSKNTKTPAKNTKTHDAIDTPNKTPSAASRIKQFEFVPPKSMTKQKKPETKQDTENVDTPSANRSLTSENSEGGDGFQFDKNIPISPRDQKLLHKVYGDAWKTPDVIRSYSAVKGKPVDREAINTTPSILNSRYSKGFDLFKRKIRTNLDSTRLDDHAEISIIETPERVKRAKSPENVAKPKVNTPRSKVKPSSSAKKTEFEPSPSVITKKKPSPKSVKKKVVNTPMANDSSIITTRPRRNAWPRKPILDSDSDKENESECSDDDSSYSDSDLLTDDDSDREVEREKSKEKPKSVRKNAPSATKRSAKKANDFIFLDLSSEEIVEVDENFHANVSEEDLANVTRKFLESDLNDEKPKKKTGRKLFTHNYDDIAEESTEFDPEPKSVKKKPIEEPSLNIEIPRFTHKLFDSKKFGSPSQNKTPKIDFRKDDFQTPTTAKILVERKTPFGSARSKLDSPPRTFEKYGFLKSLDVQASMMLCHPDAKKYRENFKAHKEELTKILFKMYNEQVFERKLDIDIIWNKKLKTTAGRFHGRTKVVKVAGKNNRIELSEKVLTSADRLRCTLIHEMCHAATWIFNKETGHGIRWKSWARKANNTFPELPVISVCHNYDIEYKYTYKCDLCQSKSYSHSKSRKVENIRCSYCHGSISIFLNKRKDGQMVMEPVREASGFAKYVKEKYKEFKKPGVKHAEVMRQISSQYSTLSQEEKKQY